MARSVITLSEDQERSSDPRPKPSGSDIRAELQQALIHAANLNWYMVVSHLKAMQRTMDAK